MGPEEAVSAAAAPAARPDVVNDFSLIVATVNGTGSQTANLALLRSFFKMGIPVNGKNIFPSNIQGLPTWYNIRISREGYVARRETSEILVAFNLATVQEDIDNLPPGGVCLHNGDWRSIPQRDDIIYYGIPVNSFVGKTGMKGKLRDYIANMVYVGALAQLLDIPLEQIDDALDFHFKGRRKLVDSNMGMVRMAHEWTAENIVKADPYRVTPMNETAGMIMMTGNEVFKVAVKTLGNVATEVLEKAGVDQDELDWLVPHQANIRIIQATAKRLDLPMDKVILTVQDHGNTSAASVPMALDVGIRDGRIKKGQLVLMEAFGGGFTWGSVLMRL